MFRVKVGAGGEDMSVESVDCNAVCCGMSVVGVNGEVRKFFRGVRLWMITDVE